MEEKVDVVVIGAGISGLCAAKLLNENGQSVVVLEAQERVGGRTHTVRDAEYNYTDVGGAYVGPTQRRVARLAKELELEFYMIDKKSKTRLYYEGKYGSYTGIVPEVTNPIKAMDFNNMQYLIDAIANDIPTEAPWRAKDAEELDSMTFQEFLNKHCWTNFAKEMGRLLCQALFCAEPRELSALFVCYYVKSGGGVTRITTVTNGAQERKFVGGAMQLSERMADGLGDKVRLEQPVIRVEQSGKGAKVTTAHGKTYTCDYVISAMPLALLNRVTFDPPLPALKLQLIQRAPMGSIIKTMMFYKEAFWKAKGFCGEMITDSGPVLYCVDDTKPDGTFPCIMGFILSNHARELTELSEDERKNAVAEHYAKVFKMDEFLRPTNYVEKNWGAEQYSGGCYVSCMGPGVLTQFGKVVKQPFGKVYFAGTETASEWAGYMDGAVQAGERAAREVLHAKGNITKSEIEQAEPPSDYFPEPPVQHMFIEKILPSVPSFLMFCGGMLTAGLAWGVNKYCDIQMNFRK